MTPLLIRDSILRLCICVWVAWCVLYTVHAIWYLYFFLCRPSLTALLIRTSSLQFSKRVPEIRPQYIVELVRSVQNCTTRVSASCRYANIQYLRIYATAATHCALVHMRCTATMQHTHTHTYSHTHTHTHTHTPTHTFVCLCLYGQVRILLSQSSPDATKDGAWCREQSIHIYRICIFVICPCERDQRCNWQGYSPANHPVCVHIRRAHIFVRPRFGCTLRVLIYPRHSVACSLLPPPPPFWGPLKAGAKGLLGN